MCLIILQNGGNTCIHSFIHSYHRKLFNTANESSAREFLYIPSVSTPHLSLVRKKSTKTKRWNLRCPEFGEKIRLSIFLQLSFLNGWSYKFLVGLNWKISSYSFHASYSFCFFEQKWLSYEGFCTTTCLLYDFKAFLSSFSSLF